MSLFYSQSFLFTVLVAAAAFAPFLSVSGGFAPSPPPCETHAIISRAEARSPLVRQTRRRIKTPSGAHIEAYYPPSTFETFDTGIDHPLSNRDIFSLPNAAVAFVASRLSGDSSQVTFKSGYSADVSHHAFLVQTHDGIPFANAVANVAFNKQNKVVSYGSSFITPNTIAPSTPSISIASAIEVAQTKLGGQYNNHPASLEFLVTPNNIAVLTHVVQIQNDDAGTWYEAFVDAHTGTLVSLTDFVAKASYLVLPIQAETLNDGGQQFLANPEDVLSSPLGWHANSTTNFTTTMGNNAFSFKGSAASLTNQSAAGPTFNYTQDPTQNPSVQINVDAARVNAFYIVNTMHDLTYRYGFTETAFNFQTYNFGKGGVANDSVSISVQDASGVNNADFTTPPDGQSGRMRMFIWNMTLPNRDGTLENDIVTHEMTHGVTNRMTGGGTGRCLQTLESFGMGEGWSDTMANWNEKTSAAVPDYVLGQYVTNNPNGIRSYPYSTNNITNPLTYQDLQTRVEPHSTGEIWANMLYNVYAALVAAHGWSPAARTNPTGTEGNIVFLHLFLDALAIQPCNPDFVAARSAWIQADTIRYASANQCFLWKAFASRGLGVGAANHTNSNALPTNCTFA